MELEKRYWVQNSVICPIDAGDFMTGNHSGAVEAEGILMQGERRR